MPALRSVHSSSVSAVELWYTRCPLPAASGIAQRERWLHQEFARDGIRVDTIRTSPVREVRDSHFTHDHPNLFREGGPVPPIWAKASGRDTALIGITWTEEARAVLVKATSPIKTLSDLRGRRLALPRHATRYVDHARAHALRGFSGVLAEAGIDAKEVSFVDVPEAEYEIREPPVAVNQTKFPLIDAVVDGRADAVFVRGGRIGRLMAEYALRPLPTEGNNADSGVRLVPGTPRAVTVNRALAVARPDIVAHYLSVLRRTAAWAHANPAKATVIAAAEIGATAAEIASGFGPALTARLGVSLSLAHVAALEAEKNFLRDHGFIACDFDFDAWIDPEPLRLAEELPSRAPLLVAV